jgi:hypothetical protein
LSVASLEHPERDGPLDNALRDPVYLQTGGQRNEQEGKNARHQQALFRLFGIRAGDEGVEKIDHEGNYHDQDIFFKPAYR